VFRASGHVYWPMLSAATHVLCLRTFLKMYLMNCM